MAQLGNDLFGGVPAIEPHKRLDSPTWCWLVRSYGPICFLFPDDDLELPGLRNGLAWISTTISVKLRMVCFKGEPLSNSDSVVVCCEGGRPQATSFPQVIAMAASFNRPGEGPHGIDASGG